MYRSLLGGLEGEAQLHRDNRSSTTGNTKRQYESGIPDRSSLYSGSGYSKIMLTTTQSIEIDDFWSFKELSTSETSYLTHGYHKYPAKFIPQLTSRLIKENSQIGDLVCDPFMGSGTTLIEAIVNGRRAYGTFL